MFVSSTRQTDTRSCCFAELSSPGTLYIPCSTNVCLNGGICWKNKDGSARCQCAKGTAMIRLSECRGICMHAGRMRMAAQGAVGLY